jgi:hypothetical protein
MRGWFETNYYPIESKVNARYRLDFKQLPITIILLFIYDFLHLQMEIERIDN